MTITESSRRDANRPPETQGVCGVAGWSRTDIELSTGEKVVAQAPVIVSASRSTDIPAFYADWFIERFKAGYVKWFNPFNGVPLYVGFRKTRLVVFWSKNPAPMLAYLDELDRICPNYYFQFTLNDYDAERIEPRVPPLEKRIETLSRPSSGTAMGEANTSSRRVASQTSSPSIFQTPSTPIVSPLSRVTTGA